MAKQNAILRLDPVEVCACQQYTAEQLPIHDVIDYPNLVHNLLLKVPSRVLNLRSIVQYANRLQRLRAYRNGISIKYRTSYHYISLYIVICIELADYRKRTNSETTRAVHPVFGR